MGWPVAADAEGHVTTPDVRGAMAVRQDASAADRSDAVPPAEPLPDGVVEVTAAGEVVAARALPAFGAVKVCPKCDAVVAGGADDPGAVRWKAAGERYTLDQEHVVVEEALIRSCVRCGFTWAEQPKVKGRA
jgi:hypothetical protein